ncbi:hypothetical protein T07_1425 [Trichinella nelsoni]|uniref:Uncharacterized protein n=1 Tax=Trichinella nelsoni TaxID=6336 RepID=A0A0V0S6L4_9BILA|nr:hypothetical protein T07_1425 [Trichinella nelsoni]
MYFLLKNANVLNAMHLACGALLNNFQVSHIKQHILAVCAKHGLTECSTTTTATTTLEQCYYAILKYANVTKY